jgi:hypothetical protein
MMESASPIASASAKPPPRKSWHKFFRAQSNPRSLPYSTAKEISKVKYIVSWSIPQGSLNQAAARFLQNGGMPPAGVKLIGRWHGMSGGGFAVVETTDAKGLYAWVTEWSDVLVMGTTPCLEDADAGAVLQNIKR